MQNADLLRTLKFLGYSNFARATTFSQSTQGLKCHRPTFPVAQDPEENFAARNCGYLKLETIHLRLVSRAGIVEWGETDAGQLLDIDRATSSVKAIEGIPSDHVSSERIQNRRRIVVSRHPQAVPPVALKTATHDTQDGNSAKAGPWPPSDVPSYRCQISLIPAP